MPTDVLPFAAIPHRQDAFSGAYIRAICAVTGCGVDAVSLDNDKVDYLVRSRVRGALRTKPQIEIQAKCQMDGIATTDPIAYSIDLETYDNLRDVNVCNPRIIVLVLVPTDVSEWTSQTEHALVMHHCAYWVSLKGQPDSKNSATQTVYFPRSNVFGPSALQAMMMQTANGIDL